MITHAITVVFTYIFTMCLLSFTLNHLTLFSITLVSERLREREREAPVHFKKCVKKMEDPNWKLMNKAL
jgi:hypothetical protein